MAQDRITAIAEFAECLDRSLDLERRLGQAHHDRKRAAGVFLAVGTVAQTDELRYRVGCIANRATEATAIQFRHLFLPLYRCPFDGYRSSSFIPSIPSAAKSPAEE